MGILENIAKAFRPARQVPITSANWNIPPTRNTEGYLKAFGEVGWLFAVVSRIAIAVSETGWHLYNIKAGERKELDTHPLLDLLYLVNPFQTGQELLELTQMYIDLVGECFWMLSVNRLGVPGEIWVLPPHKVDVVPSRTEFISGYVYSTGTEKVPLEIKEVIHIKSPNPANSFRGIGAVQACSVDIDSEDFASRWNRNFYYNEARPDGILRIPGTVTDADYERVKEQWQRQHQGLMRSHKTAIIRGADVDYKQISISAKDMDFLNLRHLTRDNILGVFGMPGSMMGITEVGSRARAEADEYVFARWLIKPRLVRIREKLNEQLCPLFDENIELDFDDPVPENREVLLAEAERGVKAGFLTVNEARQLMGFGSLKGSDVFLLPVTTVAQTAKSAQPRTKAFSDEFKEAFYRNYILKTENFEKPFIAALRTLWAGQEKEVLDKLDQNNPFDAVRANRDFEKALKPLLTEILSDAARDGQALIEPESAHRSKQEYPLRPEALAWIDKRSAWLVKGINETTRNDLARALAQGFEEGETIPQIAGRVRDVFDGCNKMRSLRIARTEVIAAANEGALEGYEATGVVEKVEFRTAAEGACEDCLALEGEYASGEAHGMIPAHVNCRCVWLPVI